MKSIFLKIGMLLVMICSALLVELAFEGNRFTKENALIAISVGVVVFLIMTIVIKQPHPQKKMD